MAYFQGFEPTTPTGRLFWGDLGGSSPPKPITIMDLGFWVQMNPLNTFLPPLETSNGLKMALNLWFSALYTYWDAILAGSGWLLASKAYIHDWPWVLGPDLPQKHLLTTSGSLKKALNSTQITLILIFKPTRMLFWVALGLQSLKPWWKFGFGSRSTPKAPFYHLWKPQEGPKHFSDQPKPRFTPTGMHFGRLWVVPKAYIYCGYTGMQNFGGYLLKIHIFLMYLGFCVQMHP